jgi:succinyl-diaminopimelate desuccinylase
MSRTIDPLDLAARLIRCPSVTPADAGALDILQDELEALGFTCSRLPFAEEGTPEVDNLHARIGAGPPNFCFAGHTDVVPVGERDAWSVDPFGGQVRDGNLYGRGATDMKAAVACFAAACSQFIAKRGNDFGGSISFLITGDEEGPAVNGTVKVLAWMAAHGEAIDACLVGEPSSSQALGDTIKIGRRGSLIGRLVVYGTQGHSAYPQLADNPIPRLMDMLRAITGEALDAGTAHFEPSLTVITTVDVGNQAVNVIPAMAKAGFNVRFNDLHSGMSLESLLRMRCDAVNQTYGGGGARYDLEISVSGEPFITRPGPLSDLVAGAVEKITGLAPALGSGGGTSDARFIKDYCPVVEFGPCNRTAHKVDENVPVADVRKLVEIHQEILAAYFA